jgi:hypothetical protein
VRRRHTQLIKNGNLFLIAVNFIQIDRRWFHAVTSERYKKEEEKERERREERGAGEGPSALQELPSVPPF